MKNKINQLYNYLKNDYRHLICISITIIFLLFSIFYFKNNIIRVFESFIDLGTSFLYYINELLELNISGRITINDFSKVNFESIMNLPDTWDDFKLLWNNYWILFFNFENLNNYINSLGNIIRFLS